MKPLTEKQLREELKKWRPWEGKLTLNTRLLEYTLYPVCGELVPDGDIQITRANDIVFDGTVFKKGLIRIRQMNCAYLGNMTAILRLYGFTTAVQRTELRLGLNERNLAPMGRLFWRAPMLFRKHRERLNVPTNELPKIMLQILKENNP